MAKIKLKQNEEQTMETQKVEELRTEELQHSGLSKKYLTDENGNKLTDRQNNKLVTFS